MTCKTCGHHQDAQERRQEGNEETYEEKVRGGREGDGRQEEKGEAVEGGGLKMLVLKMEQAMWAASRSWKSP